MKLNSKTTVPIIDAKYNGHGHFCGDPVCFQFLDKFFEKLHTNLDCFSYNFLKFFNICEVFFFQNTVNFSNILKFNFSKKFFVVKAFVKVTFPSIY